MFTLGADPEFFVTKESIVPSVVKILTHEVTPVVQDSKHPVVVRQEIYDVIVDGVALEVNFKKPFRSFVDLKYAFWNAVQQSQEVYQEKMQVVPAGVLNIHDYRQFLGNPLFYQGVIFGCDPDRDAFNVKWTARILDALTHPYRYGGGHIHFGFVDNPPDNDKDILRFVKLCAMTFGNFVIANMVHEDLVKLRSTYYGMPGKFRVQQYKNGQIGIEYRTPSNDWLSFDDSTLQQMDELANILYHLYRQNKPPKQKLLKNTIAAIVNSDRNLAQENLQEVVK